MLYLTCTIISSVDLAHYRVPRAKDRVSVDCGTKYVVSFESSSLTHHRSYRNLYVSCVDELMATKLSCGPNILNVSILCRSRRRGVGSTKTSLPPAPFPPLLPM